MSRPDEKPSPNEKRLQLFSFAAHFARGLVRDQAMRRKTMFGTVLAALAVLFAGATILAPVLDPRARPGWFLLYWLACAWLTMTAVLLAIFDLLLVRKTARQSRAELAEELRPRRSPNDD